MTFSFFLKICLVLLFSSTLISCSQFTSGEGLLSSSETNQIVEKKEKLISLGYASISAQRGNTFDLQMLNAIKVSKLEAYKEMAEQLFGVLVKAENNIEGAQLQNDTLKSRVRGLVRGAKVLRSYHEGDVYITELELDLQNSPFFSSAAEY
jgi:hypothetical protein